MKKKYLLTLMVAVVGLSGAFLGACRHSPTDSKATTLLTAGSDRLPASHELDQQEQDRIREIVLTRNENLFKNSLVKMRQIQILASSFDKKLSSVVHEEDLNNLLRSQLYCNIWSVYETHKNTDAQLAHALAVAKVSGADSVDWFYTQISNYVSNDIPSQIAMANVFRGLAQNEQAICGRSGCVAEDVSKLQNFKFDIMNNGVFRDYVKNNMNALALYSELTPSNLKPGACFTQSSDRKPQSAGYDWGNRNWVGSVLPVGQFVFTYDDGPHPKYTRVIADTWAHAGMAKPAFFWLRKNASAQPDIVKQLNKEGYAIGSHSENHADLGNIARSTNASQLNAVNKQSFAGVLKDMPGSKFYAWTESVLDREINQSVADLSVITGKNIRYFRLPYGSGTKNERIGYRFQKLNLDHFFWRVDSLDWQDKNPESIRDRVVTQMQAVKKGIVLFHDIHPQSAAAAQLIVNYLKANPSMKAVSIDDIPGLNP